MSLIGKSLIHLTVDKYQELGYTKAASLIATANELGLTHNEVYIAIYGHFESVFDTLGYRCDPAWLESVLSLEATTKELYKRSKYLSKVLESIDRDDLPIEPERIASAKMLHRELCSEIQSMIPSSICPDCAESLKQLCPTCKGFKWIPKNQTKLK